MGVLMELGNFSVGGGILFQQLLGAECNGQQARMVQDLRGVAETAVPCGGAVRSWALRAVSYGRRGRRRRRGQR